MIKVEKSLKNKSINKSIESGKKMNNSEPQSWTVDEVGVWLGEKLRDFGKKASEVIKAFKTNVIFFNFSFTYSFS